MQLQEFIADQKQLLDDFVADYERKRKKKQLTMFRPESEWNEILTQYKEDHCDHQTPQDS